MCFDLQPQFKKKLGTLCKIQNKNKIPNVVKSYLAEKTQTTYQMLKMSNFTILWEM